MSGYMPGARLEGERHEFTPCDSGYPQRLLECEGHPKRIYVLGNPDALRVPSVSIVGARKATPYGIACAELTARCAVSMGIGVVSGAAIGCDQAAQREALAQNGSVVAVLGSGANVVYPPSAADMLVDVVEGNGAIVSLLPWDSPAFKWSFVKRNAIIAALATVLVICEAGMPSGTFSTAQAASEAGREILVYPGSVFSPNSTGSNYLIASDANAMPIWDQKCLEVALSRNFGCLCHPPGQRRERTEADQSLTKIERSILDALAASPTSPSELARGMNAPLGNLMRTLALLEVRGSIRRLVDGRYSLTVDFMKRHNRGNE